MLFTSIDYFIFLFFVLILYYLFPYKFRKYLLIVASLYFYAYVKISYTILLLTLIFFNYLLGIKISNTSTLFNKKILMRLAVVINLLILVYYKYLNFLLDSFLYLFNINITSTVTTSVLLPLGLSFYTFQNIGYILDIYRGSQKPERNIFNYALFVIFFPKLLVGPIERAKNLLHQISDGM